MTIDPKFRFTEKEHYYVLLDPGMKMTNYSVVKIIRVRATPTWIFKVVLTVAVVVDIKVVAIVEVVEALPIISVILEQNTIDGGPKTKVVIPQSLFKRHMTKWD